MPPDPSAGRRRQILKAVGAMTLMTLISRITGLVREQVRGHYLGTGSGSDAFGLAATFPNLLRRLFGEGAMTAAFVPVFTEYLKRGQQADLWEFTRRFVTLLTIIVTAVCLIGIVTAPFIIETFFGAGFGRVPGKVALTVVLTQIMFPYLALISSAAVLQGVLNSFRVFGPSAFTPVLLNLVSSLVAIAVGETTADENARARAQAVGFVLGGILQLGFQIPFVYRQAGATLRPCFRFNHPGVRKTLRIMLPGIVSAGVYQINVVVAQLIASRLHAGSVSALQFSLRLQELVLGLFVISITTVVLPAMSEQVVDGDREALRGTIGFSLRLLALVCLPATVGLLVLGRPIIGLLFQHGQFDVQSTEMTRMALIFHASAVYVVAVARVLTQVFFAHQDQRTPMILAAVTMVINVAGCLLLPLLFSERFAHAGVAAAGALSSAANVVLLAVVLRRRIGRLDLRASLRSLVRVAGASLVMGGVVWGAASVWLSGVATGRWLLALQVLVLIGLGVVVYAGALFALRGPELRELFGVLRRRRARKAAP